MKKWFIADTHFSHANIIKYAGRPFANVEEIRKDLFEQRKIINNYRDRMAAHVDLKNPDYRPEWTEVKIYIVYLEEVLYNLYFLQHIEATAIHWVV